MRHREQSEGQVRLHEKEESSLDSWLNQPSRARELQRSVHVVDELTPYRSKPVIGDFMQRAVLVLAMAASLVAGNAAAKEAVCNYAAGETLLTGQELSHVHSDCHWYVVGCMVITTTRFYACVDSRGHATSSGILTTSKRGWFGYNES